MTKNNIFYILDRHPVIEKSLATISTLAMIFSFSFSPNLLVAETAPVEVVEVAETVESDLPQEATDENSGEVDNSEADEAVGDAINNEDVNVEAGDAISSGGGSVGNSDNDISERDNLIKAIDPDFSDLSLEELKNFSGPGMCLRSDNLGDDEKVQLGSNPNEPTLQEIFDDYSNLSGTPNLDVFEDQVNHQIGRVRLIDGKDTSDFNGNGNVGIKDLQMLLTSWGGCDNNEDCQTDLNGDGRVDRRDLRILLALWGSDGSFAPLKADVNKDGFVNTTDRDLLLDMFGPCSATDCQGDINGDQVVDGDDLRILLALFGVIKSDSLFLIFELDYVAQFAGNSNVFGWYRNSDLSSFEPIFQVGNHSGYSGVPAFDPGLSPGSAIVVEIPYLFDGDYTQNIGFAVDSENGSSSTKFATERSLNEGDSRQSLVYEFKDTDLMVAFEDTVFGSSDKDFNDMIVRVKAIGCSLESENEKISTKITIENSDELEAENTVAGQSYKVMWSVMSVSSDFSASGTTVTGSVTVSDASGAECSGDVSDGECEIISTTTGAKKVVASYSGDENYRSSDSSGVSHEVDSASTATTITNINPSPSILGEIYTVFWTVEAVDPGSGQPTGMVMVTENDVTVCEASVSDGQCGVAASSTGEKIIVALYEGDDNFNTSTSAVRIHQVNESGTGGGGGGGGNNNNNNSGGGSSGGGSSSGGFIGGDPFNGGLVLGEEFDLLKQKRLELLGLMQRMLGLLQDEVNRRRLAERGTLSEGIGGGSLEEQSGFVLGDIAEAQEVEEDEVMEEEETVLPINEIDQEETQNRWWLWVLIILVLATIFYFLFRKGARA